MSDTKMSQEMAEKEFERWAEVQKLDISDLGETERKRIEGAKRRIIKAFMRGALVLDDDGSLEYTISERSPTGYAGETVRIGGMTGKAWMAMDTCKADEQIHQLMAVASALTGKDVSWFGKLASRDFLVFSNIIALFMNA